jgi:hypothetical protein
MGQDIQIIEKELYNLLIEGAGYSDHREGTGYSTHRRARIFGS